jgi:hypothetical protein
MNLKSRKFQKITGSVTLILLVVLALLKWVVGWCSIWLCLLFVVVLISWLIISDLATAHDRPSGGSENDTTPSV